MMHAAMENLATVATFIAFASLKTTALLALVLIAQKLSSRYLSAEKRYLLWFAVVISLVTPVGFDIHLPQWLPGNLAAERLLDAPTNFEASPTLPAQRRPAMEQEALALADAQGTLLWKAALPLLWLCGVVAVIAAMAVSSCRFAALTRRAKAAPLAVERVLRRCEQQAGCKTSIRLLECDGLRAPVVSGLFKPVLLWPTGLEALLGPAQLQHVLMHEVTHVKRHDIFAACIVAVVQALHWFNPAIWIAFSKLRQDREMACDAATVRTLGGAQAHDYARTLIQLGAMRLPERTVLTTGMRMLDGPAQLRKRIHMLAQPVDPTARHFLSSLVLLVVAAAAFSQPATPPRVLPNSIALPAATPVMTQVVHVATAGEARTNSVVTAQLMDSGSNEVPTSPLPSFANEAVTEPALQEQTRVQETPTESVSAATVHETAASPPVEHAMLARAGSAEVLPDAGVEYEAAIAEQFAATPAPAASTSEQAARSAPVAAAAGEQAVLPATIASADAEEALICRRVDTSGSRISTRLCMTAAQWDAGYRAPRSAYLRNLSRTDFLEPLPLNLQ